VFLDADVMGDLGDDKASADDHVILYDAAAGGKTATLTSAGRTVPVLAASKGTPSGYRVEIALPWSQVKVRPSAHAVLGLDVALIDVDKGTPHAQLVWSGAPHDWADPTGFGALVLSR